MADLDKKLEKMASALLDMSNALDGIIEETIPQKLEKTWKNFKPINADVIKHADHIIAQMKKEKTDEMNPKLRADLDSLIKKWTAVNNVYGGLLMVANQCKDAMGTWDEVEKLLKKM